MALVDNIVIASREAAWRSGTKTRWISSEATASSQWRRFVWVN
jgi:hypothetical protein